MGDWGKGSGGFEEARWNTLGRLSDPARAWNRGFEVPFAEDLSLLDWPGRQFRADKRGVIPADLAPIPTGLQVAEEGWLKPVTRFSRLARPKVHGRRLRLHVAL
jgi:hypothetical protein